MVLVVVVASFQLFFLFRFYFVDGVVTKLLAQYCSELVSSRIYEG